MIDRAIKRWLAPVLLFCVAGLATARVTWSPTYPFANSVSLLDFIPESSRSAVLGGSSTADVSSYVAEAVQAACATRSKRLSVPAGQFGMSVGVDISPVTSGGIGCHNLQIICNEAGPRSTGGVFYALGNRLGGTTRDALFFSKDSNNQSIRGCVFEGNDFYGDLVRFENSNWLSIERNYFGGVRGAASSFAEANASTDLITTDSFSGRIQNGMRIEVKAYLSGAALPGGLSDNTGYWVRDKSGSAFRVAATSGGAAINLTTAGTGDWGWYTDSIYVDDSDIDLGTDTITVPGGHGWVNGMKVEHSGDGGPPLQAGRAYNMAWQAFWIVNATTDTFQLSPAPGGAPIDMSGDGNGGHWAVSYGHIRIGGGLYCEVTNNQHNADDVWGLKMLATEAAALTRFYGCNTGRYTGNRVNAASYFVGGTAVVEDNTFEGAAYWPTIAALQLGDIARHPSSVRNNYLESTENPSRTPVGLTVVGPQNGVVQADSNWFFGGTISDPASAGIVFSNLPSDGMAVGNRIRDFSACIAVGSWSTVENSSSLVVANRCSGNATDGLPVPSSRPLSAAQRGSVLLHRPAAESWELIGGALTLASAYTAADTSLPLNSGNYWHLTSASPPTTITAVTGHAVGTFGTLFAATEHILATSAFQTPTGQALPLRVGEMRDYYVDSAGGLPKINWKAGDVVCSLPQSGSAAAQTAAVSATGICGGNITAGTYEACVVSTVTAAAAAGTQDVNVGWTDAVGATTQTVVNDQPLDSTNRAHGCVTMRLAGTSDITWATPNTGLSGTPTYDVVGTIRRLQ